MNVLILGKVKRKARMKRVLRQCRFGVMLLSDDSHHELV